MNTKKLNTKSVINVIKEYTGEEFAPIAKNEFAKFIRKKRELYNEKFGEKMTTRELGNILGINYEMFRKILNQEKPTKKRDLIIALGLILHLNKFEIDDALNLYQYMPSLDEMNHRDNFIISHLSSDNGITIPELNSCLLAQGFPALDIYNKRDDNTNTMISANVKYKTIKFRIRTPLESDYYYGDPYDSLSSKYTPTIYRVIGDMMIENVETHSRALLTADTNGYYHVQTSKDDIVGKSFKKLELTGEFKTSFIELKNALTQEHHRLLSVLNDTKNYKFRSSARVIADSLCIFIEEFNYSLPELNEYYVLLYSSGNFSLKVYDRSAFMYYYLPENQYSDYYEQFPIEKESYTSIDELTSLIDDERTHYDDKIRLRMRKRAFERLKPEIITLHKQIKDQTVFINNLDYIFKLPLEVLRYYNLEREYECTYNEMDDINNADQSHDFLLSDGTPIKITLDDIFTAFKFGLETIDDIIRIKAKYGEIKKLIF